MSRQWTVPEQFKAKKPAAKQEFTLIKHRAKLKYLMCKLHNPTPWNHYLTNGNFTLKCYCSQWRASVVSTSGSVDSSVAKLFDRRHTVKQTKTLCLPATLRCFVPRWYQNLHILSDILSCLAHFATMLSVNTCWSIVCYYFSIRFTIKKNPIDLHCRTQAICKF